MAEVSLTSVDQEVAELKAHYDRQCRVMKNVGDYMYMLDVKVLKGSPFTLKIHVTGIIILPKILHSNIMFQGLAYCSGPSSEHHTLKQC